MVAGGDADDHFPPDHERRRGRSVSVVCIRNLDLPENASVQGIQSNQEIICCCEIDLIFKNCRSTIGTFANFCLGQEVVIFPDQSSAAPVESIDGVWLCDIHHAISHDGHTLK